MQSDKVIITGMICLVVLEVVAMLQGINGKLFALIIAAVAGLAGWVIPTPKNMVERESPGEY